jgi:hypothetical protein
MIGVEAKVLRRKAATCPFLLAFFTAKQLSPKWNIRSIHIPIRRIITAWQISFRVKKRRREHRAGCEILLKVCGVRRFFQGYIEFASSMGVQV